MTLTHVIIHELEKEAGKIGAELALFDSTVDKTDVKVIKLIQELNNRYKNRNEIYGVFDTKKATDFHTAFNKYYKSGDLEKSFIEFSKTASKDLEKRIDSIAPAKGGYLIFAQYESTRKFVAVFLVRNTIGVSFKANTKKKKFDITNVPHIDFENLAMACRINVEAFKKKEIRYLSFISKQGDEMSSYFTRWISSTDTETNEEDTSNLYNLLYKMPLPKDEDTGKLIERAQLFDRIYTNIKSTPGRIINIRQLSNDFYGDPDLLPNYIDENDLKINGEFKAHPKTLRKFIQIRAKGDEIELSFPHSAFKTLVRFDEKDKTQIIIKSQRLVEEVKAIINSEV